MKNFFENKRYTLVDFWASWCLPCREEMKSLKSLYTHADTSKFKIISISLDANKNKWITANTNDQVTWPSYYDSLAFNSNVAKTFNIRFVPDNVLVNNKGEIVAININTNKLEQLLKENKILK